MYARPIDVERKAAAFYAVLLALVVLDILLLFWIFNPFTRFGSVDSSHRPFQDTSKVDDRSKPSPFELASRQAALSRVPPPKPKLRRASFAAQFKPQ